VALLRANYVVVDVVSLKRRDRVVLFSLVVLFVYEEPLGDTQTNDLCGGCSAQSMNYDTTASVRRFVMNLEPVVILGGKAVLDTSEPTDGFCMTQSTSFCGRTRCDVEGDVELKRRDL